MQCVPAALIPRQRRRRFPERELLERLRRYEGLLRENGIEFEPLHTSTLGAEEGCSRAESRGYESPGDRCSGGRSAGRQEGLEGGKTAVKAEIVYEAKYGSF